jgi:hypothetical protein
MRRGVVVWGWIALASTGIGLVTTAHAQMPVCAPPAPHEPYYTACAPAGRFAVTRLLYDLAIDHLLKPSTDGVTRRAGDLLRSMLSIESLEKNAALRDYFDQLDLLKLTKLDTVTGTFEWKFPEEDRRFRGGVDAGLGPVTVGWDVPARLVGGYWRTPGVLQIAFWRGDRATIRIGAPSGEVVAEVECLVVSTDGIRAVTSGADTPDLLVRFDECD